MASELLWTTLKLVTAVETMNVPLLAQWMGSPTQTVCTSPPVVAGELASPEPPVVVSSGATSGGQMLALSISPTSLTRPPVVAPPPGVAGHAAGRKGR